MQAARADKDADTTLWSLFREGDEDAFREIYYLHADTLFNYALNFSQDKEFIKDCMQDLFTELWKQRGRISAARSVKFYLMISLRRHILRQQKKLRKQAQVRDLFLNISTNDSEGPEQPDAARQPEQQEMIEGEFRKLPARQRQALWLRFYKRLEYEEIQDVMHLNYQVVRNVIYRGLKKLRARLHHSELPLLFLIALAIS